MARLVNPYQRSKTGSLDVSKGLLARQRRVRRVLRSVENRALLSTRLEGHHDRAVRGRGGRLHRWYNETRIKISLGSLSPVEYRKSLGLSI
ncbi:Uncharacterised protein [Brucella anthropi]|nr:Uncharacterised protein [Brucella anthropi]